MNGTLRERRRRGHSGDSTPRRRAPTPPRPVYGTDGLLIVSGNMTSGSAVDRAEVMSTSTNTIPPVADRTIRFPDEESPGSSIVVRN